MRKKLLISILAAAAVVLGACAVSLPWLTGTHGGTTGYQVPRSSRPTARSANWWYQMHDGLKAKARQGDGQLLFLGDSITQNMDEAKDLLARYWGQYRAANFGIGGDTTENLLWRLQNGELAGLSPRVVVLLIGTNNLFSCNDADIVSGIKANVDELRKQLPSAKIVILGILPRGQWSGDTFRKHIKDINAQAGKLADDKHVYFMDIGDALVTSDGWIKADVMSDFLHPTHKGYQVMFEALRPKLEPLLKEQI